MTDVIDMTDMTDVLVLCAGLPEGGQMMGVKWDDQTRDVLAHVGQIEAVHRAEQDESNRLCDEHGWRWFSDWNIDILAYRFLAIPLAPYKVFVRMTQGRTIDNDPGVSMITRAQQAALEAWIRENGVTVTVSRDVVADAYVAGHRAMRKHIRAVVTRRPLLSKKHTTAQKDTPADETDDARQARLDRASGDYYSHQQRLHTLSYGGARMGTDLQPEDRRGPLAQCGHSRDD